MEYKLPSAGVTFINAIAAGTILSIAAGVAVVCGSPAMAPEWGALLKALIFPAGLLLIVLGRLSLFTGNIYSYGACIAHGCSFWKAFILLIISWFGNLLGCLWSAFGIRIATPGFDLIALEQAGAQKLTLPHPQLLILAIFCNMLVCMAIALSRRYGGSTRIIGVVVPIFLFVFFGFEHSIADMFYLLFAPGITPLAYFMFLGVVTAGNVLGGILVTAFDYARKELV